MYLFNAIYRNSQVKDSMLLRLDPKEETRNTHIHTHMEN